MSDISLRYALTVLLAETTVASVLDEALSYSAFPVGSLPHQKKQPEFEQDFSQKCVQAFPNFSLSDTKEIARISNDLARKHSSMRHVFALIQHMAVDQLREDCGTLVCPHNSFVLWRQATHGLGQSPFMCAYWAWKDKNPSVPFRACDFAPYVKTDNLRLQQLLAKGMAENHFHLKGSAPIFLLSWVCLMNNIENREAEFSGKLFKQRFFQDGTEIFSLHERVLQAAFIRLYFWKRYAAKIHQHEIVCSLSIAPGKDSLETLLQRLKKPGQYTTTVQRKISVQRFRNSNILDYAGNLQCRMSPYGPLEGEHTFLYCVFRALFNGRLSEVEQGLLHAYLIISVQLRRELVQANHAVGFSNFAMYQDRKEVFLERYWQYKDALIRMAHASVLSNPAVLCLEARVTPKNTAGQLTKAHRALEQRVVEANHAACCVKKQGGGVPAWRGFQATDEKVCRFFCKRKNSCRRNQGPCRFALARVSYVQHFVKEPEPPFDWNKPALKLKARRRCRHFEHRLQKVERPAAALERWRDSSSRQATRVHGIDACNFEIGCRPEVFAPAFRRLRNHVPSPLYRKLSSPPTLRVTYHVGEDFLDVVDGLRAIDEALRFLDLRYGDRLGHAIALGIDAADWYAHKGGKVFLPKQDLLDNLAWFYCRLLRRGLGNTELEHRLNDKFTELYIDIYGGQSVPISVYFNAWKLRGNHPKHFLLAPDSNMGLSHKLRLARFAHEIQAETRTMMTSKEVYRLVHRYHYDHEVRAKGATATEYRICSLYVQAVSDFQKAMRAYIAGKGIGIESNPSSNFLIGTYKDYRKSPLLAFNDLELRAQPESELMFVSINTDDQGIFDTTLENEYALMACAMESLKDAVGNPVYPPERVYRWLDNIRSMGLEQSFKLLHRNIGGGG